MLIYEKTLVKHEQIVEVIVKHIVEEIVQTQCIHGVVTKDDSVGSLTNGYVIEDNLTQDSLNKANIAFVNSVSLLSILFDDEVQFDELTKERFAYLIRVFDCCEIFIKKYMKTILNSVYLRGTNLIGVTLVGADLTNVN